MKTVSILNHVLGPVMRGPSSSHTAGAYHLGCMARSLLGGKPARAILAFDPDGSYAVTYAAQGADRGFAMGLMDKPLTDDAFFTALQDAPQAGLDIRFETRPLENPDHPNTVEIDLTGEDEQALRLVARSVGGGEVEICRVNGWSVLFNGTAHEFVLDIAADRGDAARRLLEAMGDVRHLTVRAGDSGRVLITGQRPHPLPETFRDELAQLDAGGRAWVSAPVYFPHRDQPGFTSTADLVRIAEDTGQSLGEVALETEARLLGLSEDEVTAEILRRYDIMAASVKRGLDPAFPGLQLLPSCAGSIFQAEAEGRLSVRSLHTRAAARALAVMHVDGAMGVVCAAPTGGSAGVIPGALVTLAEERALPSDHIARALMAAGSIGAILAIRGTFAAEVAGCQVEIGASGAMAAAAIVDAVGGSARQACDAAAIAFQNTMGTVCDLLHGLVEIPCHTRNGAAAAAAFVNADLVLGGYPNLIPLDETIDAVYAVGLAMPSELRCTSKGGLAVTPSALALTPGCCGSGCARCPSS